MRSDTIQSIDQIAIHYLGSEQVILSNRCLALQAGVSRFFQGHLERVLQDSIVRAACFQAQSKASLHCQGILSQQTSLIDGSKELAGLLSQIMRTDHRISDGDLVVLLYTTNKNTRRLGLMKMDLGEAFRQQNLRDEEGEAIELVLESDILPTKGERVQKSALIRPAGEPYDMLLLDRQSRAKTDSPVAQFFSEKFLETAVWQDDLACTKEFYTKVTRGQNNLRSELTERQDQRLRQHIRETLGRARVNTDEWLSELEDLPDLELSDRQIQVFRTDLENMPDRMFTIDRKFAEDALKKSKYTGSGGLKVEFIDESTLHSVTPVNSPGVPPYWEIVLRTKIWKKV